MNNIVRDFCASNNTELVKQMLRTFSDIDILYNDGDFFYFPISKGNVEICKALITYFEEKQFQIKNIEYYEAKDKLTKILENATDSVKISPEMKEVLEPYVGFEDNDSDRLNDSLFADVELSFEAEITLDRPNNYEGSNLIGDTQEIH